MSHLLLDELKNSNNFLEKMKIFDFRHNHIFKEEERSEIFNKVLKNDEVIWTPHLTPYFWKISGLDKNKYDTFVETGTYRGFTIDYLKNIKAYKEFHTIEITDKWYNFCREKYKNDDHIHTYHGDSSYVLPKILDKINKPCVIFLDAHYSGGTTGKSNKNEDTPILDELEYLKNRPYDDIIILDDIGFVGQKGGKEPDTKPNDNVVWGPFHYDWSHVSMKKILNCKKPNYTSVQNFYSLYTLTPRDDQLVWFPKNVSK